MEAGAASSDGHEQRAMMLWSCMCNHAYCGELSSSKHVIVVDFVSVVLLSLIKFHITTDAVPSYTGMQGVTLHVVTFAIHALR